MRVIMSRLSPFALGAGFLILSTGAAISEPSGADLHARCANVQALDGGRSANPFTALSVAQCFSYIDGLTIGLQVGALLKGAGRSYCPPDSMTSTEAVRVIQEFLADFPELTGEDAGVLAADALMTKYPCRASMGDGDPAAHALLRRWDADQDSAEP
jgi:hypothetical protein